jgi:hypothetical protein
VGARLSCLPENAENNDARNKLIDPIHFPIYDVRYLLTLHFEPFLSRLLSNADVDVAWIASDLAKRSVIPTLLHTVAAARARHSFPRDIRSEPLQTRVAPKDWLHWWHQATNDLSLQQELLSWLPAIPSAEVEEVLLNCLESQNLRGTAARRLGEYGSIRSAGHLRNILAEGIEPHDSWAKAQAARALGELRDEAAIALLEKTVREHTHVLVLDEAISSLGLIGTHEAECALARLLSAAGHVHIENLLCEALLFCGSMHAVATLVQHANDRPDGQTWLCERLHRLMWFQGWHRGEFYTHIHTAQLVQYLTTAGGNWTARQNSSLARAFNQIDGTEIRSLLRRWTGLRGSPDDLPVREEGDRRISDVAFEQLRERGDESAISFTLDQHGDKDDRLYIALTTSRLQHFSPDVIAERLRERLRTATTNSEIVRTLSLLGRCGRPGDAQLTRKFQDHSNDLVANVACETTLRLSDPLLIPDHWREL